MALDGILPTPLAPSVDRSRTGTSYERGFNATEFAAVKEDKAKALGMFNKGEGGFKDRDLYVWCANASDGIVTAQPYMNRGKQLRDLKGKQGAPFGETIMQNATPYWWPRPGADEPLREGDFLHEGR